METEMETEMENCIQMGLFISTENYCYRWWLSCSLEVLKTALGSET